jgi:hypothetical protein
MQARSASDDAAERGDLELDVVFAVEPLDEAIDVAFLAVRCAQQAIRSIPETATADRFRDEWRTNNVLVRQALRLVDERVQDLARRLSRGCPASADAACFGRTPGWCPVRWCSNGAPRRVGPPYQAAMSGRLTLRSSLSGAMVSRLM